MITYIVVILFTQENTNLRITSNLGIYLTKLKAVFPSNLGIYLTKLKAVFPIIMIRY
ncbi:hypothetical protein HanXRQr2_Chr13g0618791 [Helianthus annuus]|uniref:Uncharacterized protein n=1 Tax=Helianthus annuus TaxID=4232 RepID=A0A9K3HD77_HELAN|nr:hypothetical protein HanXRQr2_Chr13g0618791 [Helianthus annuus]